jgi:diadenosine tetraphosphate (Ap4A) HIT family hydrolase
MNDCIFCKIVAGVAPSHPIWESDTHLAFLSIFPNTEGVSVVIPKKHYPSYIADLPDEVTSELLSAGKLVAKKLDAAFSDVGRTGFIFEGFGVDHIHLKLFPMHGTTSDTWKQRASHIEKYFENYEGYLSSHDHERADDMKLSVLAEKIRSVSL